MKDRPPEARSEQRGLTAIVIVLAVVSALFLVEVVVGGGTAVKVVSGALAAIGIVAVLVLGMQLQQQRQSRR
jgi:hypothetical protein